VLTDVTGQIQPNVSVWAVYGSEGWHLVLVNGSASSQLIDLSVPATGAMTLTPLSSPSPWSGQVTFGGQTITPAGTWSGAFDTTEVQPANGVYPVVLPPASATIADVSAAPGTTIAAAVKGQSTVRRKQTDKSSQKRPAKAKQPAKAKRPVRTKRVG
jgi:hypothetical protein